MGLSTKFAKREREKERERERKKERKKERKNKRKKNEKFRIIFILMQKSYINYG